MRYLVELSPRDWHVVEVPRDISVKDFLSKAVQVVSIQTTGGLHLRHELAAQSLTHLAPGHTLRHHKRYPILKAQIQRDIISTSVIINETYLTRWINPHGGQCYSQVLRRHSPR